MAARPRRCRPQRQVHAVAGIRRTSVTSPRPGSWLEMPGWRPPKYGRPTSTPRAPAHASEPTGRRGRVAVAPVPLPRGSTCRLAPRPPEKPMGRARCSVAASSKATVFHSGLLPRPAAVEVAGAQAAAGGGLPSAASPAPRASPASAGRCNGRVVEEVAPALVETWNSLRITWPMAIASAGVGALLGCSHRSANFDLGVVGRHHHRLGALVGPRSRSARRACASAARWSPRHDEGLLYQSAILRHVGLLAPDLRAGRRQVAVPVVKLMQVTPPSATDSGEPAACSPSTSPGSARSRR